MIWLIVILSMWFGGAVCCFALALEDYHPSVDSLPGMLGDAALWPLFALVAALDWFDERGSL